MNRSVWKWLFGVSLAILVLLVLFTVFLWALGNSVGALGSAIMSYTDNDVFAYNGTTFDEFLGSLPGSPLFYMYIADIAVLLSSITILIVTHKIPVE